MTTFTTVTHKCPTCSNLIERDEILSGNTFDAVLWSDAKFEAPMLPDQPQLMKCPYCETALWVNELEKEGDEEEEFDIIFDFIEFEKPESVEKIQAKPCQPLVVDDYKKLLKTNAYPVIQERYLRLTLWWMGNDKRRTSEQKIPLSEDEMENLNAFLLILDEENTNDLIMKVEILRELKEFDSAKKLLAKFIEINDKRFSNVIRQLKVLIENKDESVRKIDLD